MSGRGFAMTQQQVCSFAYDLAEENHYQHNFDRNFKRAGRDWLKQYSVGVCYSCRHWKMSSIVYQCMPTVVLIVIVIWDEVTCLALQKCLTCFFLFCIGC